MLNKLSFFIVPAIHIFGILFLGWNLTEVIILYGLQLYIIGIITIISLLLPIRRRSTVKGVLYGFVTGLYGAFIFLVTYGLMTFIGSWVILEMAFKAGYIGQNDRLESLIRPQIIPGLISIILAELIQAYKIFLPYYRRKEDGLSKVSRAYTELVIYLLVLIIFFYAERLINSLSGNQIEMSQITWFALVFVGTRFACELAIEKYRQHSANVSNIR